MFTYEAVNLNSLEITKESQKITTVIEHAHEGPPPLAVASSSSSDNSKLFVELYKLKIPAGVPSFLFISHIYS